MTRTPIAAALLAIAAAAAAAEPAPPSSSGGLAWFVSDDLDLVGTMRADVPFEPLGGFEPFVSLQAVTAIEKSVETFTFDVRDLPYALRAGARRGAWTLFAGVRGVEGVDADDTRRITLVGAAWEAPGRTWRQGRGFLEARAGLAAVVDSRGIAADADVSLEARAGIRSGRLVWALDLRVDTLLDGTHAQTDLEGGPRLVFPSGDARTFSLFVHGLRSRHPLGLRASGVLFGFEAAEAPIPGDAPRPSPPDLRGTIAAGIGDDAHRSGRLRLAVLSPPWVERWRAILDVDANVLTAADTGELYYLYDLGVERAAGRWAAGAYFHHRSNHVLAEENPVGVTSHNVAEIGLETSGWTGPARARTFDTRVRLGALIDSSFGDSRGWNVRAGARVAGPAWGGAVPWFSFDLEEGDASARRAAAGLGLAGGFEIRADFVREEQFFGSDDSAFTLGVAAYF
ncbi:MAG TPA: hypothetical protein VF139_08685 [Candidatus Polarisedimenticolaceae bacterium]